MQYAAENKERFRILNDTSVDAPVLKEFTVKPEILFFADIDEPGKGNYWINEKMAEYYSLADFCFLSLRDEGAVSWTIPGKLQEYMSAGKAILAAINGDAKFVIEDAHCGVCVGFDDCHELAKVIVDYSKDKTQLKSYGENARNYYLKHFTLAKHVDSLEKELERLMNKNDVIE